MGLLYSKALGFDVSDKVKDAIQFYKASIDNGENIEEAYSNLIVILIESCFDYGFSSFLVANKIFEENEIRTFYTLLEKLINEAIIKFKNNNEFEFWRFYTLNYYKDFNREALTDIIERDKNNLVPYFYLYVKDIENSIPFNHYIDKIDQLKKIINQKPTFKNRYIKSFIHSAEHNIIN